MQNPFAPRLPAGMSEEQARQAGILPPIGHRVPAAPWSDQVTFPLRIARCIARYVARRAEVGSSRLGSGELREELRHHLELLGVRLEVHGAERLISGGQVLMWNQTSHLDHLLLV